MPEFAPAYREPEGREGEVFDLERFRNGDMAHLDEVVRTYGQFVRVIIRSFGGASDDQEDLFQSVWLQVIRHRTSYRGEGRFEWWLHRIAVNICRMAARERTTREACLHPMAFAGVWESLHWGPPSPLDQAVTKGQREWLAAAVEQLPPGERKAVELRHFEGYTAREIAEVLGVKESTARSQVRNGLVRLRRLLRTQE